MIEVPPAPQGSSSRAQAGGEAAGVSVVPTDEGARMAAVERYAILDTPPDGAFDRITALAARLFEVPVAIVSVVDHDRIWFKSHYGVEVEEIGRDLGLCASAILHEAPWVVTDAPNDPRALANPLVAGDFGVKFYAGAPLRTGDGHNLGTMCILGFEPRVLTEAETQNLTDLASLVMSELELRLASLRAVAELQERMATEAAMQQRLRAAERMEGLAALAAGVAHDFNNLLTIILGNAGLLSMDMPPGPMQERARAVLSSAQHARAVASQLLAFSRGQLLQPKETTLADMLDDLEVTIRDTVGSSVEVKRRTDGHQPTVLLDAEQMRRVIVNLVMNAVEAMPQGGAVTITTDSVTFSQRGEAACDDSVAAGRYARLTVSDVGDGMDPSLLGRIFEPYFTTKADRSGTGLGLPTAYGIARQSGGHLWLESTLGVGTGAHLIFPSGMGTPSEVG